MGRFKDYIIFFDSKFRFGIKVFVKINPITEGKFYQSPPRTPKPRLTLLLFFSKNNISSIFFYPAEMQSNFENREACAITSPFGRFFPKSLPKQYSNTTVKKKIFSKNTGYFS